jgi:hypothetical protein
MEGRRSPTHAQVRQETITRATASVIFNGVERIISFPTIGCGRARVTARGLRPFDEVLPGVVEDCVCRGVVGAPATTTLPPDGSSSGVITSEQHPIAFSMARYPIPCTVSTQMAVTEHNTKRKTLT